MHASDIHFLSCMRTGIALFQECACVAWKEVPTRGTSPDTYFTGSHLPLDSENIHASLAASRLFCSSSTYLQPGLLHHYGS